MFGKLPTTEQLSEKPVFGTQRPLLTPFSLEPTMRPASNTTAPTHVGTPPPPPTSEPFDKNTTDTAANTPGLHIIKKLLEQFTFNQNPKAAYNTSLFHIDPFKPINVWKPFNLPDSKPKLNSRPPTPATRQTGPLVIAKVIAGLSGCFVIILLICLCIYSKKANKPKKERRARRDKGVRTWYCGDEPFDTDDPVRYSYTDPERPDHAESHHYSHEHHVDVCLEMGTDLCFDVNTCDADAGGTSNDCGQD
ncbi:hypothetical protein PYW08_010260 [Mythimna loreyi]|uniref:Uncharacterized protein n=1 Tax=Mythimna loreyi TaxID=667449 RepID=A0ACC2QAW9_9NEOP|nr:hypothetical protein PYW08_010260 [Mythimna loreyi]